MLIFSQLETEKLEKKKYFQITGTLKSTAILANSKFSYFSLGLCHGFVRGFTKNFLSILNSSAKSNKGAAFFIFCSIILLLSNIIPQIRAIQA